MKTKTKFTECFLNEWTEIRKHRKLFSFSFFSSLFSLFRCQCVFRCWSIDDCLTRRFTATGIKRRRRRKLRNTEKHTQNAHSAFVLFVHSFVGRSFVRFIFASVQIVRERNERIVLYIVCMRFPINHTQNTTRPLPSIKF